MQSIIDFFYTLKFIFESCFEFKNRSYKNNCDIPDSWKKYKFKDLPNEFFSEKNLFVYKPKIIKKSNIHVH